MNDAEILIHVAKLDGRKVEWTTEDGIGVQWYEQFFTGMESVDRPGYLTSHDSIRLVIDKVYKSKPHQVGNFNAALFKEATGRNLSSAVKEPLFIYQALTPTPRHLCNALLEAERIY